MTSPNGSFFRSRWVDAPPGVAEVATGPLPRGFRAAGVACGMKASGRLDLGVYSVIDIHNGSIETGQVAEVAAGRA